MTQEPKADAINKKGAQEKPAPNQEAQAAPGPSIASQGLLRRAREGQDVAQIGQTAKSDAAARVPRGKPVNFTGMIRRIPFRLVGNWQIGSRIVAVTPQSIIEGEPGVGHEAKVEAEEDGQGAIRVIKMEVQRPPLQPKPRLGYLRNTFGLLAALSLFFPLTLSAYPYLPGYGSKAIAITTISCLLAFAYAFMNKKSLYESRLRRSVRGGAGMDTVLIAYSFFGASVITGFAALLDLLVRLREAIGDFLMPELATLTILPLQIFVFFGITVCFSILAALSYMEQLKGMDAYRVPPYLNPSVDLIQIGMETVEANLAIPRGTEWKVIERKRQPDGGILFVLSWTEQDGPDGTTRERAYEVTLGVRGQVVSFSERT